MTITEFCRSEHGRGLNQQKLYRRVRRLAREEWPDHEDPSSGEHFFREAGLRVGRRANGDRRYEVTRPQVFRGWALREAGWTQPSDPEEVRALLEGARLFVRIARGDDEDWGLGERKLSRTARQGAVLRMMPERARLIDRLEEIAERHLPPEAGPRASGSPASRSDRL